MRHTPATLRALAAKHGCSLDIEKGGRTWQIILDAPEGKLLRESGCHCSATVWGNGFVDHDLRAGGGWDFVAESIEEIIALGFDDCDDPDCDVCFP